MTSITITINEGEKKILNKRAKKNLFTLKEQVEDIIRRSCVTSANKSSVPKVKVDDKLVGIFSRQRSGRKKKKKVKKKK